jgi:hypothetical protein
MDDSEITVRVIFTDDDLNYFSKDNPDGEVILATIKVTIKNASHYEMAYCFAKGPEDEREYFLSRISG